MVWQFIEVFKKLRSGEKVQDDDFADRLSHRYSVAFFLLFTILVGSSSIVGNQIACWCPAQFTGSMVQYTNYICWISNTYFVPTDNFLPHPTDVREFRINYYQWVPWILALMALLFHIPYMTWHLLSKSTALESRQIMKILGHMDASSQETRDKCVRQVVRLIDRAIDYQRDYYDHSWLGRLRRKINRCFLPSNRSGYYLHSLYLCIKLMYLGNVCSQFFLLNMFLGPKYNIYGFHVIRDFFAGKDFWESERFPRVTMCDFSIRNLGENNHLNTIQCTLPINLFNEKLFIFIWFWLCFVAGASVYSFIVWFLTLTSSSRMSFVRRYLKVNERISSGHSPFSGSTTSSTMLDAKIFDAFLFEYLKHDGVFLLRIIKKNTSDMVTGEVTCTLWDHFKRYPKFASNNNDDSLHKEQEKLTCNGDSNGYH